MESCLAQPLPLSPGAPAPGAPAADPSVADLFSLIEAMRGGLTARRPTGACYRLQIGYRV
jgi:hypothetical protein